MEASQKTMSQNYANGGPGVFVSGLIWMLSAIVIFTFSDQMGMIALFIGGMAIHPVSGFIEKRLKMQDAEPPNKGLTKLALLTLPLLFAGIFLGYFYSGRRIALFFAVVAITIGLRYLIFERIYGLKSFWVLGLLLIGLGLFAVLTISITSLQITLLVGIVELAFGAWLTQRFLSTGK